MRQLLQIVCDCELVTQDSQTLLVIL